MDDTRPYELTSLTIDGEVRKGTKRYRRVAGSEVKLGWPSCCFGVGLHMRTAWLISRRIDAQSFSLSFIPSPAHIYLELSQAHPSSS